MENVVFISGTGRSGSGILRRLLSRHSMVTTLPFESRFIVDPDGIIDFYRNYSETWTPFLSDIRLKRLESLLCDLSKKSYIHNSINRTIARICSCFSINRIKVISPKRYVTCNFEKYIPGFKQYAEELISDLKEFSYEGYWVGTESYKLSPKVYFQGLKTREELSIPLRNFLMKVISSILINANASYYVDHNTWNSLFAKDLLHFFPSAKIIHIWRDPRDVVASYTKQRCYPKYGPQAAVFYKSIYNYWFSIKEMLDMSCYYEIKLEDLVGSPESSIKNICSFLDLPFEEGLLNIDLSKSNRGRWEKDLHDGEKREVQEILKNNIIELGYE